MIRELERGDRPEWTRLWTAYLRFYETTLPDAVYERTWQRLFDATEPMFGALALAGGKPVGLVHYLYHRSNWSIEDSCYLQDLFVDPAVRGGGHGRALIAHVTAEATTAGSTRLYWQTHETNATAQRLYDTVAKQSGFVQYRIALGR